MSIIHSDQLSPLRNAAVVGCDGNFQFDPKLNFPENVYENVIRTIKATGRIEAKDSPIGPWLGTAFLIRPNVIVTVGYVAENIEEPTNDKFSINFSKHINCANEREFKIIRKIYDDLSESRTKRLTYLQIEPVPSDIAEPLVPTVGPVPIEKDLFLIAHTAYDRRKPPGVLETAYKNVFDVKRVLIGNFMEESSKDKGVFTHDALTSGGSGGAPVVELMSGRLVGVHFSSIWGASGYAYYMPKVDLDSLLRKEN